LPSGLKIEGRRSLKQSPEGVIARILRRIVERPSSANNGRFS